MNKFFFFILISFFNPLFCELKLTPEIEHQMGIKIWKNECSQRVDLLTCWNESEEFASLGIGHFIWYPENEKTVFDETFPKLLDFFKKEKVELPQWLSETSACPWSCRSDFLAAQSSMRMQELRHLLSSHVSLQVRFMIERMHATLPRLVAQTDCNRKKHVKQQYERLSQSPKGLFALVDYINFKGDGLKETERYQGHGWGLLQVLSKMQGEDPDSAVEDFIASAKLVLEKRVELSPPHRNEKKWLKGWFERLNRYKLD